MALALLTIDDLARIAAAGGGFRIDGSRRAVDDLARLAAAAGRGGGSVTITGLKMYSVDDLARLAAAGKGHVILED
ncbi:hypothetical protein [Anaeromyxobacter soli]|uniref:hypothetical protein n=1 Tax=Anaeromyxobacter soli TaxID=2922725 RepID=UPI001FAED584|nr:hypothetical protein [Anaeromyxobacter sp. SG29]